MKKYHCSKGHYSEYWVKASGYRTCKECHRLELKKWRLNEVPKVATFEINYAAWLNNRIAECNEINSSVGYINGLKDARKIFIMHNPLLELVV